MTRCKAFRFRNMPVVRTLCGEVILLASVIPMDFVVARY